MPGWNIAEVWEAVADVQPDAPAQVHRDRRLTWKEFDRRADGVAAAFLELGVERQDKVAQYLYNGPEYLESLYGAWKAGLVPVNTNYRYTDDENASTRSMPGWYLSRPCLTGSLHITPEDATRNRLARSQR